MKKLEFNDCQEGKYKYIGTFSEGLALVRNTNGLFGYINKKGKEVIPCKYPDAVDFSEGLAIVSNAEGLKGYIDSEGKEVIPCQYTDVTQFKEGLASVEIARGNVIYIDKTGKQAISDTYGYASSFSEGLALIKNVGSNRYNYIDKDGKIIEMQASDATCFRNGTAIIIKDAKICIIDKSFQIIDSYRCWNEKNANVCENGLIMISYKGGTYRYYNQTFQNRMPGEYLKATEFIEGYAIVEPSSEWIGILSKDGSIKLFSKEKYIKIENFSEGLAAVQNPQGLWGYLDTNGQEVIPCQYKAADPFKEGLAGVQDNENNLYYISKNGKKKLTFNQTYYSSLELGDKTITIKAENEQELAIKKLQVLGIVKKEILQILNKIDELAYIETPNTYERTRKNNRKPK